MRERYLIAAAVRRWHPPRLWAVCDNVSWGFDLNHEADAICISKSGIVHELEAKSSASDLKRDLRKRKWKEMDLPPRQIDFFWYVVPESLADAATAQARPRGLGVVVVHKPDKGYVFGDCNRVVAAKPMRPRHSDRKRDNRTRLWRLATLRYWDNRFQNIRNDVNGK